MGPINTLTTIKRPKSGPGSSASIGRYQRPSSKGKSQGMVTGELVLTEDEKRAKQENARLEAQQAKLKAPKEQFRSGGGAAQVFRPDVEQRNLMISNLALQQQISREGRAYASKTQQAVVSSPSRREELKQKSVGGAYDTYSIGGGRVTPTGPVSMAPQATDERTGFSQREMPIYSFLTPQPDLGRGKVVSVEAPAQASRRGLLDLFVDRPFLEKQYAQERAYSQRTGRVDMKSRLAFARYGAVQGVEAGGKKVVSYYDALETKAQPYAEKFTGLFVDRPFLEKQYGQEAARYYSTGKLDVKGRLAFARYGAVKEFEERPVKQAGLFLAAAALPPSISGGRYYLAKYGLETAFPVRATGAVFKYGAPSIYAGVTAAEIYRQPGGVKRWETVGRKASEFGALYAGGRLGVKIATPIEYQTALVQEVRGLPKAKQERFWELYKEAKAVEKAGIPPKRFDLSGFERIPAKARPVIKDFLAQKDVVVYGSAGQRPFLYGKAATRSYATSDVDVASLVKGGSRKDALALAKALKSAGVGRVSVVPRTGKVTIAGQKAIEFHEYSKIYGNIRQVTPFYKPASSQFVKTPEGITVLKPGVQARRKLVGAYLDVGRFGKDLPDYRRILQSAVIRAETTAGESAFFQRERVKELQMLGNKKAQFLGVSPSAKVKVVQETPEVFPSRSGASRLGRVVEYKYPEVEYRYPEYKVSPSRGAYPSYGGVAKSVVEPVYSYSDVTNNETFKYKPYLPNVGTKVTYSFYPAPQRYGGGGGGRGAYSFTNYPIPEIPTGYTTRIPSLARKTPPPRIPEFDMLLKGISEKRPGRRRRPFKYQASLKAVAQNIKVKRKKKSLSGYEVRGIV